MPRWTASLRRPTPAASRIHATGPTSAGSHRRRPVLVVDPGTERRRDPVRRAQVEAMLAVIDDPEERVAYLRNVRSQPREVLPR